MDDHEKALFADLLRIMDRVGPWVDRISPDGPRTQPADGSPLAGDDRRVHPHHLSHAALHSINHAVDNLNLLRSTLQTGVIYMYGQYSLARGGLENASTAVWLLAPARRPERLLRHLRRVAADINTGEDVNDLMGIHGRRPRKERLDDVNAIAERLGITDIEIRNRPGFREIVKTAGSHTPVTARSAEPGSTDLIHDDRCQVEELAG